MIENFTQKVRQAAIELGEFTGDDLADRVPAFTYKDKGRIRKAVQELRKSGEVISIKKALYRYGGKRRPLSKQARIWRAIKIKEYFTRRDIVQLSGASDVYVKRYFTFLKRKAFIEHISGRGYKGGLYCLTDSMKAPLDHPTFNSNRKAQQRVNIERQSS